MFITNNNPQGVAPQSGESKFGKRGAQLLQLGQYAQAYILLSQELIEAPEDASVYYNLGLCCLFAGQPAKALQYLDAGFEKLNTGSLPQEPKADMQILLAIEQQEANTDAYKNAMYSFEILYFFKRTKDRFLRLIIDACVLMGDSVRARQIADMLKSKNYKNVQEALQQL